MTSHPAARNEIADVVGPGWSPDRTCAALGITADVLAARREAGTILAVTTADGVAVYPAFQFQPSGDGFKVSPALVQVFRALREFDPWAVAVLMHTPAPELDGVTPLDWIADGGSPEVLLRLAKTVAREWAAGSGPG